MAREIQHFTATIPAGTPVASPVTVSLAMPPRIITRIDWRVPHGPMGVFAWQVAMGGLRVFPSGGDTWVKANDEHGTWEVHGAPDSGAWQVIGYNTGANPHSVYLAFYADLPVKPVRLRPLIRASEFMPSPDLSRAGPPLPGGPLCC